MVGFGSCREQDFQFCLLFQQRLDFHKRARTDLVANFTSGDFDLGPDSNKLLIRFESKLLELVKMDFTMLQSVPTVRLIRLTDGIISNNPSPRIPSLNSPTQFFPYALFS